MSQGYAMFLPQGLGLSDTPTFADIKLTTGASVGKFWKCTNVDGSGAWDTAITSETDPVHVAWLATVRTANTVFAGPTIGASAAPTFRTLVDNDIPDIITLSGLTNLAGSGSRYVQVAADGTLSATNPAGIGQIFISGAGAWPSTTSGCAVNTKSELATNDVNLYTLDFDAASIEYAEATVVMPSDWDGGTITAIFHWMHGATITNFGVVWGLQGRSFGDDEALDQAFGSAQEVTDTGGTTSDLYVSSATAAITLAGTPAAGELVQFKIYRNATSGSDNLAVDAKLVGVMINYMRI